MFKMANLSDRKDAFAFKYQVLWITDDELLVLLDFLSLIFVID